MILRSLLRQQAPLRATAQSLSRTQQRISQPSRIQCRSISNEGLTVPMLNDPKWLEEGIPGLFSADGVDMAWTRYQGMMVDKLNALLGGTRYQNKAPKDLVLETARDANMAVVFNHASMAFNNDFFFKGMTSNPIPIPTDLESQLTKHFSSLSTFKSTFLTTALSMFGPGFVWLVRTRSPTPSTPDTYRILTTYLAGTPLPEAHHRQQPIDMSAQNMATLGGLSAEEYRKQTEAQNKGSFVGPWARPNTLAPGGVRLEPLLCVNTWEHVYLRDWGVEGKEDYLNAWWEVIDWSAVHSLANIQQQARRGR